MCSTKKKEDKDKNQKTITDMLKGIPKRKAENEKKTKRQKVQKQSTNADDSDIDLSDCEK